MACPAPREAGVKITAEMPRELWARVTQAAVSRGITASEVLRLALEPVGLQCVSTDKVKTTVELSPPLSPKVVRLQIQFVARDITNEEIRQGIIDFLADVAKEFEVSFL